MNERQEFFDDLIMVSDILEKHGEVQKAETVRSYVNRSAFLCKIAETVDLKKTATSFFHSTIL